MKEKLLPCCIVFALAAVSVGLAASAAAEMHRVGFLVSGSSRGPVATAIGDGLVRALAAHGYTLGANLSLEGRFAEGREERLPALVRELVGSRVEVIVASGYKSARAAKEGAPAVPIVVVNAGDPVETGLVASLAHPGGNITGISDMGSELAAKRLELLKQGFPGLQRVAILYNAGDPGMATRYQAALAVAPRLGIAVQPLAVREPDDFDSAFAAMTRQTPDGIMMVTDLLTFLNRKRVFEFAAAHRLPAIYEFDLLARQGGLMSYGPAPGEAAERAADLVVRILKGAKPADLPFEQPTRFRFVINLQTAKALGFKIPQNLLARADEVIE
jgi:putative ABC transport system substrate-binding protein